MVSLEDCGQLAVTSVHLGSRPRNPWRRPNSYQSGSWQFADRGVDPQPVVPMRISKDINNTKDFMSLPKSPWESIARVVPLTKRRVMSEEKLYGEIAIENNELERFENRTQVRRYEVDFNCPEFTCICPRSGFPDFATIQIRYVPDQWCVELKSLKLYINSFRNKKVFHEDVTNNILDDLVTLLDPHEIEVVGDFNVRGNIKTVVKARHSKA